MSLLPTREETGFTVIYEKLAGGDASMPNNITCWIETTPLVRGVCRKKIHVPYIASLTTTATTTSYKPIAGYTYNLNSVFKNAYTPMMRGTTAAGFVRNMIGDSTIRFDTTALAAEIMACDLDIETISY